MTSLLGGTPKISKPKPIPVTVKPSTLSATSPETPSGISGLESFINTGPIGLLKKAKTKKRSLLGGSINV